LPTNATFFAGAGLRIEQRHRVSSLVVSPTLGFRQSDRHCAAIRAPPPETGFGETSGGSPRNFPKPSVTSPIGGQTARLSKHLPGRFERTRPEPRYPQRCEPSFFSSARRLVFRFSWVDDNASIIPLERRDSLPGEGANPSSRLIASGVCDQPQPNFRGPPLESPNKSHARRATTKRPSEERRGINWAMAGARFGRNRLKQANVPPPEALASRGFFRVST